MVMISTGNNEELGNKKIVFRKLTEKDINACLALQDKILKEQVPAEWVKQDQESQRRYDQESQRIYDQKLDDKTIKGQKYIIERNADDYKKLIENGYGGVGVFDGDKLVGTAFIGSYKDYTKDNLLSADKIKEDIETGKYKEENIKELYGVMVDKDYRGMVVEREDGIKTKLSTALIAETLKNAMQQVHSKKEHLVIAENAISNARGIKFTQNDLGFEEKTQFVGKSGTSLRTSGTLLSSLSGLNDGETHEYTMKGKLQEGQKVSTLKELAGLTSGGTSAQSVQSAKATSKDTSLSM